MKLGFNLLLWATHVTDEHWPIIEDIKATGYDGVEVPMFEGDPEHYRKLGDAPARHRPRRHRRRRSCRVAARTRFRPMPPSAPAP